VEGEAEVVVAAAVVVGAAVHGEVVNVRAGAQPGMYAAAYVVALPKRIRGCASLRPGLKNSVRVGTWN
jgi:hypothetical protein